MKELREEIKATLGLPFDIEDDFLLSELDSLSRAEVIVIFEEKTGKQLTNAQILSLKTFKDLETIAQ